IREPFWICRRLISQERNHQLALGNFRRRPAPLEQRCRVGKVSRELLKNFLSWTWGAQEESHAERLIHLPMEEHPGNSYDQKNAPTQICVFVQAHFVPQCPAPGDAPAPACTSDRCPSSNRGDSCFSGEIGLAKEVGREC